jgi:hypothetical protein
MAEGRRKERGSVVEVVVVCDGARWSVFERDRGEKGSAVPQGMAEGSRVDTHDGRLGPCRFTGCLGRVIGERSGTMGNPTGFDQALQGHFDEHHSC